MIGGESEEYLWVSSLVAVAADGFVRRWAGGRERPKGVRGGRGEERSGVARAGRSRGAGCNAAQRPGFARVISNV
jgi:hypothetical protein